MIITDRRLVVEDEQGGGARDVAAVARAMARQLALVLDGCDGARVCVQVREKDLSRDELVVLARELLKVTRGCGAKLVVNGDAQAAREAGADGVHLPEAALSSGETSGGELSSGELSRSGLIASEAGLQGRLERVGGLIGVSSHSLRVAVAAARRGVDYVVFGPVFATPSKAAFGAPQGVEALGEVARVVAGVPVIAVGGIELSRVAEVIGTGAAGVAAIRPFWRRVGVGANEGSVVGASACAGEEAGAGAGEGEAGLRGLAAQWLRAMRAGV